MKKVGSIGIPAIALITVFALAGRVLSVGKSSVLEGIVAAAAALLILPLAARVSNSFFEGERRGFFGALFSLAVIVAAFYVAAAGAREFSSFASEVMLLRTPKASVSFIFLFLCAYLTRLSRDAVRKFALLAFVVTAAAVVLLFLLSVRSFDLSGRDGILSGGLSAVGVLREFGEIFAPSVLAVIYLSMDGDRVRISVPGAVFSVVLVSALLFICRLNVRLLFGESFASGAQYPYSEAVSTVTAGKLFARMEGWAYLMYYAASAVRVTVCLSLIFRMLPQSWMRGRVGAVITLAFASAIAAFSL